MHKKEAKQLQSTINETRRKLLKLGVYSAPTLLLLGKVSGAKASGQPVGPKTNNSGEHGCGLFEKIITLGFCK
jgi:hypothetical protein